MHEVLHVPGADVMAWDYVQPVVDSIMTLRIRPLLRAGASLIVIFDGEPGRQAVGCGSLAGSTGGSTTALGTLGCSGAHSPTTQLPKSPKSTGEWASGSQPTMSASSALSSRYNSWPNPQKRTYQLAQVWQEGGSLLLDKSKFPLPFRNGYQ